jgi:transposase-like protein
LSNRRPDTSSSLEAYRYLIFDGTYLNRPVSILALMNAGNNMVISGKYGASENSDRHLLTFFNPLITRGLNPLSCTVDGNPQVIRTLKTIWSSITIQRCLVHIQRQGLMWCRRYPKTVYAVKLRDIFLKVTYIHTREERDNFLALVNEWEEKYGQDISIQPERGKIFSDIKRARSMLLKALPDMFHYLDDPNIPFSTNSLESYFSRLKSHYRQHRGLSKTKLDNYFHWYIFLSPK